MVRVKSMNVVKLMNVVLRNQRNIVRVQIMLQLYI